MSHKPDIARHHSLSVRTITPVSIGADEADALSPYADYVIEGSQIVLLDKRRVEQAVLAAGLLDEYVTGIGDSMEQNPNRSGFSLSKFIRERLKSSPQALALRILPNRGMEPHRKQSVAAIVKEAGRAYLPGSTLKGALRSAMLYDWLVGTKAGEPEIKSYQQALPDLERAKSEMYRLKKIFKQQRLFREFDASKREVREQEKRFFREERLFGKLTDGPESRFIRVADSSFADADAVGIYGTQRIRLQPNPKIGGRDKGMPTPREALFSEQPLSVKLDVVPGFATGSVLAYWAEKSTAELLAIINQFSKDCIANELYELRQSDNRDFQGIINRMEKFYEDLEQRAQKGAVFLRIGFGKTIYDNSLSLAMFNGLGDEGEDAFTDYRRAMWDVRQSARNYPVTRTVTAEGEPLGWVEIAPGS